jgi:hypothetical protein
MTDDMIMASDYYPVEELSPILAPSIFDEIYNSQLRNGDEPEFFSPSDIMNEECTYPATPIQTRSVPITGRSIYNNQYCTTDEKAIEVSTLCCNDNKLLDFGVIYEDGGQFG